MDGEVVARVGPFEGFEIATQVVPGRVGYQFGFHLRFAPDVSYRQVDAEMTHPPMGPNRVTRQTWRIEGSAGFETTLGYVMEDAFEIVPGIWSFRLRDAGRTVFRGDFEMAAPGALPAIARARGRAFGS